MSARRTRSVHGEQLLFRSWPQNRVLGRPSAQQRQDCFNIPWPVRPNYNQWTRNPSYTADAEGPMAFYDLLDAATLPNRPHERTMSFLKSSFLQVVCRVHEQKWNQLKHCMMSYQLNLQFFSIKTFINGTNVFESSTQLPLLEDPIHLHRKIQKSNKRNGLTFFGSPGS